MVLYPVIGKLVHKRVVLASASPRRREILNQAGLRFEVVPSRFKEKLDKSSFPTPYAYAIETAKQKALEVAHRMHSKDSRTADLVIGADTIVTIAGLILEKPVDKQDAYRMLSRLSGKEHSVFTGVTIVHCSRAGRQLQTEVLEFYEETRVTFSELSEEMLWAYIHSGEPMDKAGGYGIQALGGMLVEHVRGDFLNVVGFPLNHFCKKLSQLYCPPTPDAHQESIPAVGSVEKLRDPETLTGQANAGEGVQQTACNGTVESQPPCPWGLLDLIHGFKGSKVLLTACKLKVFDVLKDGAVLSAADVAAKIDASVHGTEWLLEGCAELGLLLRCAQGYRNTELASVFLASDAEYSLQGFITLCNNHTWDLFTHLETAVREGGDQLRLLSGRQTEDLFKDPVLIGSEEMLLQWMRGAHDLAKLSAQALAKAFDLSRFKSACHLGGCTGTLAYRLAQAYPHLQVTVFDLPKVIELAPSFHPCGWQAAQVSFLAGDIFQDGLPEAELYILSRDPYSWPDDVLQQLLSKVSEICKPGCALLIAGPVLDEERQTTRAQIPMLLRAHSGGRTTQGYERLLRAHGFHDVRVVRTGGLLDAVLATR
ncbi:PREDICTED: N-acetylserotonin O-methyltransferase-like protein [Chrysochloris asiatica]|uniref:N-acetylserotonin O-methyltransferase-like protein n=1 Tax=Chrysochloris asiatica TaxID=185453 RepID=A0A9B0U5M4_CHRAS|nr:PREDICTED: N-acetylserotonin O-methyltransferase-like protein [Chrysochloris asiatica]